MLKVAGSTTYATSILHIENSNNSTIVVLVLSYYANSMILNNEDLESFAMMIFHARVCATHAESTTVYASNSIRVTDDYVPDTILYPDGTVYRAEFERYWTNWSPKAMSKRLGPSFAELHPDAPEDRPTIPQPGTWTCPTSYLNKYSPYELGIQGCATDNDYWSTAGQVGYIPVNKTDPGMDRIQTLAYYDNVFALSPRWDLPSGTPHPDPQTRSPEYNGSAMFPVASKRNYAQLQNEALTI